MASLSLATRGDKQTERDTISKAIENGSDTMRMRIVAHQSTFERRDEAVTRLECLTGRRDTKFIEIALPSAAARWCWKLNSLEDSKGGRFLKCILQGGGDEEEEEEEVEWQLHEKRERERAFYSWGTGWK